MSLLNTASDGLPNVLVVIYQALSDSRSGLSEEALLARLEPPGTPRDQRKVLQTLRRWTELDMFYKKNDRYQISDAYRVPKKEQAEESIDHIRAIARTAVLNPDNNVLFWEAENSKAADLTRSLAWLLAQDVYSLNWTDLPELESQQLNKVEARFARNSTRLNGLRIWATFLGFLWQDMKTVAVDPTAAIRDVLTDVLPKKGEVPVSQFIERLVAILPILDTGRYRQEVESNMDPSHYPVPESGMLSASLSRALYRLRREELIELHARADSRSAFQLTGAMGGKRGDTVTHVSLSRGV